LVADGFTDFFLDIAIKFALSIYYNVNSQSPEFHPAQSKDTGTDSFTGILLISIKAALTEFEILRLNCTIDLLQCK
jgi:hypothetical protein